MKGKFVVNSILIVCLCIVSNCCCRQNGRNSPRTATVELCGEPFTVELAVNPQQKALGLMFRGELAANSGMLLVFDSESPQNLYMKNCLVGLDAIFVRSDGTIVKIAAMNAPVPGEPLVYYSSGVPVKYAIELPAGTAGRLSLKVGDKLKLPRLR